MIKRLPVIAFALFLSIASVSAQTNNQAQTNSQTRNIASGQKMKLNGVVVAKDNDKIVVRDATGVDTNVM
jgi:hypothetical protein